MSRSLFTAGRWTYSAQNMLYIGSVAYSYNWDPLSSSRIR